MGDSDDKQALAMKVRRLKCITLTFIVLNLFSIYLLWRYLSGSDHVYDNGQRYKFSLGGSYRSQYGEFRSWRDNMTISDFLTVVIHDFEEFENDVPATVQSFLDSVPGIRIVVVSDKFPYPPLHLPNATGVRLVTTDIQLTSRARDRDPLNFIKTRFVLLVPDATRVDAAYQLKQMLLELEKASPVIPVVAARFSGTSTKCLQLRVNVRKWTLEYLRRSDFRKCDAIGDKQVILTEARLLAELSQPFMRPFPEAFYVQTAVRRIKVQLLKNVVFQPGRPLFLDPHLKWKAEQLRPHRLDSCYRSLGMKRVISDENGEETWHGCRRDSPRCFSTVIDDTPDYLFMGKWTPPCCLEGLRETARHVFQVLEEAGVRYWLEGGSLLGAVRNGDIIPWDYDIDLGMYKEDLKKCKWLLEAEKHTTADDSGFVWEKAREGDFYRVQFSHINRLHVDIFPFYPVDGVMTKDTWIKGHPQDREFPEAFLIPLSKVEFVGMDVSAPNNVRDFLELKFGKGVIEHPQYPNTAALRLPNLERRH